MGRGTRSKMGRARCHGACSCQGGPRPHQVAEKPRPALRVEKKACTAAAWGNRWDLLRQLLSMGCPIDEEGMFGVVACDPDWDCLPDTDWDKKFEILKWLDREHGCDFFGYWIHSHVREVVTDASECSIFPFNALLLSLTWCFFCSLLR